MLAGKKLVCGVGINDSDYVTSREEIVDGKRKVVWVCPFYRTWSSMLKRCYGKSKIKYPSYSGCSVCEKWHLFSNFKKWMETQKWEGKQLDKDIISPGNKIYSPENCCFVDSITNNFVLDRKADRGRYMIGVHFHKNIGKFMAQCSNPFLKKSEALGYFDTEQEAHQAWLKRKRELANLLSERQDDERVKVALIKRYT